MSSQTGSIHIDSTFDIKPLIQGLEKISTQSFNFANTIVQNNKKADESFKNFSKSISYSENNLNGLNNRLEKLQSALAKSNIGSEGFSKIGKAIEETKNKIDLANQSFEKIPSTFDKIKNSIISTLPIFTALGVGIKAINIGLDFSAEMQVVKASLKSTDSEFQKLSDRARELGATTSFSATDSAKAMGELGKAGLDVNSVLNGTNDVLNLALAGSLDLATASTYMADSMNGFGLITQDVNETMNNFKSVSDVLANSANASSISVQDLGETFKYVSGVAKTAEISIQDVGTMTAILGSAGIKGSMAGTSLKAMITRLAAPTTESTNALKQLGISAKDIEKDLNNPIEILSKMQSKMIGFSQAKKIDFVSTIFGVESASGVIALMDTSKQKYAELKATVSEKGGAEKFGKILNDNLKGDLKGLSSVMEEFFLKIALAVDPILRKIVQGITSVLTFVSNVIEFFSPLAEKIFGVKSGLLGLLAVLTPLGIGFLASSLSLTTFASVTTLVSTTIIPKLLMIFSTLKTSIASLFTLISANPIGMIFIGVSVLLVVILNNWEKLSKSFEASLNILEEIFSPFGEKIFEVFNFIEDFFSSNSGNFLEFFKPVQPIIDTIKNTISSIFDWIKKTDLVLLGIKIVLSPIVIAFNLITIGIQVIINNVKLFFGVLKDVFDIVKLLDQRFSNAFSLNLSADTSSLSNIFSFIDFESMKKSFSGFINWIVDLFNKLDIFKVFKIQFDFISSGVEFLKKMFFSFLDWIQNLFSSIGQSIEKSMRGFFGEEIFQKFMNIKERISKWFDELLAVFKKGWQAVKKFFEDDKNSVEPPKIKPVQQNRQQVNSNSDSKKDSKDLLDIPQIAQNLKIELENEMKKSDLEIKSKILIPNVKKSFEGEIFNEFKENIEKKFSTISPLIKAEIKAEIKPDTKNKKELSYDLKINIPKDLKITDNIKKQLQDAEKEFKINLGLKEEKIKIKYDSVESNEKLESDFVDLAAKIQTEFKKNVLLEAKVDYSIEDTEKLKKEIEDLGLEFKKTGIELENGKPILKFSIASNGVKLTPEVQQKLREIGKPINKEVTFTSAKENEKVFQVSNNFYDTVKKIQKSFEDLSNAKGFRENLVQGLELVKNSLQAVGQGFIELLKSVNKLKEVKLNNFKQSFDWISQGITKMLDENLKNLVASIDSQISALDLLSKQIESEYKTSLEQRESEFQASQEREEEIYRNSLEARKIAFEEYLQSIKTKNDEKYNEEVIKLEQEYQLRIDQMKLETVDKEQALINENILWGEFDEEKRQLRNQSEETTRQEQEEAKKKEEEDLKKLEEEKEKAKEEKEKAKEKEKDEKEKIKDEKIKENEKKKELLEQQKIKAQEENENKKNAMKKQSAIVEYVIALSSFQANKQLQLAQAKMSMANTILSGVQAWAMLTAQTGLVGLVLGGVFMAMITGMALATGMNTMNAINSTQPPLPPVFEMGGLVGGNSHSMGGTMIEAEKGEFVINKNSTSKNFDLLDNINRNPNFTSSKNESSSFNYSINTSVQVQGNTDQTNFDMLANKISDHILIKVKSVST